MVGQGAASLQRTTPRKTQDKHSQLEDTTNIMPGA